MSTSQSELGPAGRGAPNTNQDQDAKCSCGRALLPLTGFTHGGFRGATGPPPHPSPSIHGRQTEYRWQDGARLWCGETAGNLNCCAGCEIARTLDHSSGQSFARIDRGEASDCPSVSSKEGGCAEDVEHCCVQAGVGCRAGRTTFAIIVTTWLRLGSLLVALLAVTVNGAPTAMTLQSRKLSDEPKWLNPCGFAAGEFDSDLDVVQLNDETLLGNIVMQAKTALHQANSFRDDYIERTFGSDYAAHHSLWSGTRYDWLPNSKQIPKSLGEQLDQDFLDKLEVRMIDTALLDAYEYMQKYAVGLEQIVLDQDAHNLGYFGKFEHAENLLRSVLCELQMALAERGVTPRPDVTRDIMAKEFRDMSKSATYRNLRDWLIFRDYMNGLEFIVQVFEHLVRNIQS